MGSPAQSGPWISPWKHIAMLLVTPITAVIGLILGDLAIVLAILSVPLFIRAAILFYGLNGRLMFTVLWPLPGIGLFLGLFRACIGFCEPQYDLLLRSLVSLTLIIGLSLSIGLYYYPVPKREPYSSSDSAISASAS